MTNQLPPELAEFLPDEKNLPEITKWANNNPEYLLEVLTKTVKANNEMLD